MKKPLFNVGTGIQSTENAHHATFLVMSLTPQYLGSPASPRSNFEGSAKGGGDDLEEEIETLQRKISPPP